MAPLKKPGKTLFVGIFKGITIQGFSGGAGVCPSTVGTLFVGWLVGLLVCLCVGLVCLAWFGLLWFGV